VGITPMMSFLHSMADRRDPRPVLLLYADRHWEGVAYREELQRLEERLDLQVVYVLQDPPEDWPGERGMIDSELMRRHLPQELILRNFFICGPAPMMDAVQQGLLEMGVRQELIHTERFNLA
jgi:ferredoxin-NADP reductase